MSEPSTVRSPYRVAVFSLLGIAILIALLWTGTFLYWKIRIDAMIVQWENYYQPGKSGSTPYPDISFLHRAGCRSLPSLIQAVNRSPLPHFQQDAMERVLFILVGQGPLSEAQWKMHEELDARFNIYADGVEFERKAHLADFNAWWSENGSTYHQWWRPWSDQCHE